MSYVLAVDQGTQSSRAAILNRNGLVVTSASMPVSLLRMGHDSVEQDGEEIVRSVQVVVNELLGKIPAEVQSKIECCGIATQRSTVVAWDADGAALSPALNWQDTRGHAQLSQLWGDAAEIKRISGLPLSAHYGATKLHWLAARYKHAHRYGPISSFLLSRICCGSPNQVDHANAQRMQLLDIGSGDWSQRLLDLFDIDVDTLPECTPTCHNFGELVDCGIPITAMNGDQNSAWFGCGLPDPGSALVNMGSGAFVLASRPDDDDIPELLTSLSHTVESDRFYLLEATVNGAGNALQWLGKQHGIADYQPILQAALEQITDPPIFLNTVGGLGSPWWKSGLEPVFEGSQSSYSQYERLASVCESILFLVYHNICLIKKHQPITQLHLSGGLSQVDQMCQKLANLSNLTVRRNRDQERTIKGIAWLAAGRPENWSDPEHELFHPEADPGLNSRFEHFLELLNNHIEDNKYV